jgi:hypothetical protein
MRSRFAEDCLRESAQMASGSSSSLGAGFDTFAYRQPKWAKGLRILRLIICDVSMAASLKEATVRKRQPREGCKSYPRQHLREAVLLLVGTFLALAIGFWTAAHKKNSDQTSSAREGSTLGTAH